ncbi:MAG: TonB-dependent siderophore receptor [Parvularculaceae bacterium]|nr:TonB-dependent siderophore receptor [Parvularculaceae bacterium]
MVKAFRASIGLMTASISALAAGSAAADDMAEIRIAMIEDQILVTGERAAYANTRSSSATKTDTALIDIPQSISVINRDLIDDQAFRTLADVSRYVPGLGFGQGEGHRDAPVLRGNQSTADLFIDGVRDDAEYFRDLYNVDRIEVLKGPNAMIFGRGAGGGLINRVTRKAEFDDIREITLAGGQFASGRGAVDLGGAVTDGVALRLNAFYENSDSYRDFTGKELFGINPTGAVKLGDATTLRLSYEYFNDRRDVDRGVPSLNGLPFDGDRSAFFGNPDESNAEFDRHAVVGLLEHDFSDNLKFRNSLSYASNDKFYQNVFASGAVNAGTGAVSIQSYFSSQQRRNLFNQSDFILKADTGPLGHTILFGVEAGVQKTENFRTPNNAAGTVNIASPVTFAPSPFVGVQNDNLVDLNVVGIYVQDQIEIGRYIQLIGGVRYDRFDLEFDDQRLGQSDFERTDEVFSPRAGVVFKPAENASLYFSYSKSFLPQSGDQFGSLTASFAALEPEVFENLEIGAKWNLSDRLELAGALYRLDRENTRAVDPLTLLTVLTGAQRSKGAELTLAGSLTDKWEIIAGYSYQDAEITATTSAAPAGRALALVPEHSFSLWSTYQILPRWRVGAGVIHQGDRFATLSNAVTLPDFTRVDAAVYFALSDALDLQVNVENLTNALYFSTAHNDNNITPGAPRHVRAALTARF